MSLHEDHAKLAGSSAEEDLGGNRIFRSVKKRLPWLRPACHGPAYPQPSDSLKLSWPSPSHHELSVADPGYGRHRAPSPRLLPSVYLWTNRPRKAEADTRSEGIPRVGLDQRLYSRHPPSRDRRISGFKKGMNCPCSQFPGVSAQPHTGQRRSSLSGTVIPIFFQKIWVDPAVASGPSIVNQTIWSPHHLLRTGPGHSRSIAAFGVKNKKKI